jgi:hypothetical protein
MNIRKSMEGIANVRGNMVAWMIENWDRILVYLYDMIYGLVLTIVYINPLKATPTIIVKLYNLNE